MNDSIYGRGKTRKQFEDNNIQRITVLGKRNISWKKKKRPTLSHQLKKINKYAID